MTVESNNAIALVLVLVSFLIGSKNGDKLLFQLEKSKVLVLVY